VALLGTFHPAVPTLAALAEREQVAIVVLPERAGPKNDELVAIAERHSIPWTHDQGDVNPATVDLVLAANYPDIVPRALLDAVPCVNTHWSLLPRHRGVHPTAWALLNGDTEVGVTVHLMADDFDTGDVLRQGTVDVRPDEPIARLHERLAELQAELVLDVVDHVERHGSLPPATAQDDRAATYVPQRFPSDGLIDWSWPTWRLDALVRALHRPEYPGAFTTADGRRLIIWSSRPADTPEYHATPGRVVRILDGAVWVKTGDTALEVHEVQWDGEGEPVPAPMVLRQGQRLGIRPELEIPRLDGELADLRAELADLRALVVRSEEGR
jgi:methionyl-tRNA formyltransferase